MSNRLTKIKNDEKGMASIIIVMVIIMILTLVVLAMSRNANREQRQALDRQLSSQAFYASESGINDTVNYVRGHLTTAPKEKTACKTDSGLYPGFPDGNLTTDGNLQYSCVLYDLNPATLQYDLDSSSTIIPIQNSESKGVSSLTFQWEKSNNATDFTGCPDGGTTVLPESWPANCDAGMLRLEIIDPNNLNRSNLVDKDFTSFIYPVKSAGSIILYPNGKGNNQGIFGYGNCTATATDTKKCSLTIDSIGLSGASQLFLRVKALYQDSTLVISGKNNVDTGTVKFLNAQIMVDSTGKANDVLKRLQVRVPVRPKYDIPDFAVQTTDDLCKKIDVYPTATGDVDGCN